MSATGTGSLDLRTGAAPVAASYAFAVSGTDVEGKNLAVGGVLDFEDGTLVTDTSVFDVSVFNPVTNTSSAVLRQRFQSGSVSQADQFTRLPDLFARPHGHIPRATGAGY